MVTVTTSHARRRPTGPAAAPSAPSQTMGPTTPSSAPTTNFVEPGQRQAMIAEAAYFLAERRGFCPGSELDDWFAAESEIDRALGSGQIANRYGA